MRPVSQRLSVTALLALAAIAVPAGCSGSSTGDEAAGAPMETTEAAGEVTDEVTIDDFEFIPADFTAQTGRALEVTNEDTVAHTLSAESGGAFDTGAIESDGDSAKVEIDEPGTYPYVCEFHPTMKGTLTAVE